MSERGGATTQSGIYYQNSISALYLGELIDPAERLPRLRVVSVRVEAPEEVDDTVVTYEDGHRLFIQAKENVRENEMAWHKLWQDFKNQFERTDFKKGEDKMLLAAGTVRDEFHLLQDICENRASTSENVKEFFERLNERQKKFVRRLKNTLFNESGSDGELDRTDENLLSLLKHIEIEIRTLGDIERDIIRRRIPPSNRSQSELFRLLRDRIGGKARRKGTFAAAELQIELSELGIEIVAQPSTDKLLAQVASSGAGLKNYKNSFGDMGIHLERSITAEIVDWAQETTFENNFAVLLDQAGMGKTVVAQDVLLGLENCGIVVLAIKADTLSGIATARDLQEKLELPDRVERVLARLADNELTVLLIDQIDALSLSLAHDQAALDVLLKLAARARLIPNVKILISCRTFDFNNDPRLASLPVNKSFRLPLLTADEVKTVVEQLGLRFDILEPATKTLLQTPLHLELFARVVAEILIEETADEISEKLRGLNSLQDLYVGLWRYLICKDDFRAPKTAARERVLRLVTERIDASQEVSVPKSSITDLNDDELTNAAQWLASQGILITNKNSWTLLHQTFFDYCYAKNFVESGASLYETLKNGEQGLFVRSQIVQVLNYWRGVNEKDYLSELNSFLNSMKIRFHLRDHVLRWFGALSAPTEQEWLIARRYLNSAADGERLRWFIQGNIGWFAYLRYGLVRLLESDADARIDNEAIPFLSSVFDRAQSEIISIVRPFLGRSEIWNKRIRRFFLNVPSWDSETIGFFEELFKLMPEAERRDFHEIDLVAKADAKAACRLIRIALDKEIEEVEKQENQPFGIMSLRSDLEHLNGSSLIQVLETISESEPEYFLREMLPWLKRVFRLSKEPDEGSFYFRSDLLKSGFDYSVFVVTWQITKSLVEALVNLAKINRQSFLEIVEILATLRYDTAQRLLTRAFEQVSEEYFNEALRFLVGDSRRLMLGEAEVFDSRRLIKSIVPYLNEEQAKKLEDAVFSLSERGSFRDLRELNYRFRSQFYLMHSFLPEKLTAEGRKYFAELQRKFPNLKISERPSLGESGFVGSPIAGEAIKKMSDDSWIAAFRKYSKGVTHKEFLKGGAEQLSSVLAQESKEQPERFYALAMRTPLNTEPAYIAAFINGLADSAASAEKLFEVVRRFAAFENEKTARATARALEKRAKENFPDDLLDILETKTRGVAGEDEEGWRREEKEQGKQKYDTLNSGPYISYLNSDRGAVFRTVMRVLDARDDAESKRRKWELLEFSAANGTDALKAGVIEELLYESNEEGEKRIALFEDLIRRSPVLLFTHYALEFIYWTTPNHFERWRDYIESAMESPYESVQEHAATLACLAPLYKQISENAEVYKYAAELADKARTGKKEAWRRGAVNVYASNLKSEETRKLCLDGLTSMLGDSDEQVKRKMSRVFYNADESQFYDLQNFTEHYAKSKFSDDSERDLAEFLWKHGTLEPEWSLSIIKTILKNRKADNKFSRDGEFYIRLVLQIYKMPYVSPEIRTQVLDLFDELMRFFTGDAFRILNELDSH